MISARLAALVPVLALLVGCDRSSSSPPAPVASVQAQAQAQPAITATPVVSATAAIKPSKPPGPRTTTTVALKAKAGSLMRLAIERDGEDVHGFLVSDSAESGTHLAGKMIDERRFRLVEVGKRKHPSSLEGALEGSALSKVQWHEGKGKAVSLAVASLEPFRKDEPGQDTGYAGAIGDKLRVRVQLKRDGKALSGYYRYARSKDDLKLQGSVDLGSGKFEMTETGPGGKPTGRMKGTFLRAGQIVGSWESIDGARSMPLWLSSARPLPKIFELPGGGKIIPRDREGTLAPHCVRTVLFPELDGLANRKAQDSLNKELAKPLVFSSDKDLCEGATADLPYSFEEAYTLVSSKRKKLLGIEFSGSEYTGGAHPIAYQSCSVLDLEQGTRFDLASLLVEGAQDKLAILANGKLRDENKVQDLTEAGFFDSEIKVSKDPNLCLHDESISLVFSLYEIAPYAMGMPEVEFSFDEIRPLMKKEPIVDALLR